MQKIENERALEWSSIPKENFGWITAPFGEGDMRKINVWAFYVIGYQLHKLAEAEMSKTAGDYGLILLMYGASMSMRSLRNSDIQLSAVGRQSLERLYDAITTCITAWRAHNLESESTEPKSKYMVEQYERDFRRAKDLAQKFEVTLANEFEGCSTFFIPQKGTHQTALLMESAVTNLPEDLVLRLLPDAIKDINEAGKCLALEASTAAGFHILRAVESLMRDYHFKLVKTHLKVQSRNWGNFIKVLVKAGADPKVTGFLTHIKDQYRNPIVHPEETLTSAEAFSLFNACLSAITMLDKAIQAP